MVAIGSSASCCGAVCMPLYGDTVILILSVVGWWVVGWWVGGLVRCELVGWISVWLFVCLFRTSSELIACLDLAENAPCCGPCQRCEVSSGCGQETVPHAERHFAGARCVVNGYGLHRCAVSVGIEWRDRFQYTDQIFPSQRGGSANNKQSSVMRSRRMQFQTGVVSSQTQPPAAIEARSAPLCA